MTRAGAAICLLLVLAGCDRGREPAATPEVEAASGAERRAPAALSGFDPRERADERERMVRLTIERRGVRDPTVLAAMRAVPRHLFVPPDVRRHAYEDRPLSIGYDQTISQPYIVASMTEELHLRPGMKVLEIGTGSGYQAAVLAHITRKVHTIEIRRPLHERAARVLARVARNAVKSRCGDGYYGWEEEAPFDAIVVTAAAPHVPPPLVRQLAPGGRMVLPVGRPFGVQDLRLITRDRNGRVKSRSLYPVRFVPLTGSLGRPPGGRATHD